MGLSESRLSAISNDAPKFTKFHPFNGHVYRVYPNLRDTHIALLDMANPAPCNHPCPANTGPNCAPPRRATVSPGFCGTLQKSCSKQTGNELFQTFENDIGGQTR